MGQNLKILPERNGNSPTNMSNYGKALLTQKGGWLLQQDSRTASGDVLLRNSGKVASQVSAKDTDPK